MKAIAVILILLSVGVVTGAQEYRYLLIYRGEGVFVNDPPPLIAETPPSNYCGTTLIGYGHYTTETKCKLFATLDEMLSWLNSGTLTWNSKQKTVAVTQEDIIAIYDLSTAKQIKLELHTEEIVKPKRVEVHEERWTNEEWRIK